MKTKHFLLFFPLAASIQTTIKKIMNVSRTTVTSWRLSLTHAYPATGTTSGSSPTAASVTLRPSSAKSSSLSEAFYPPPHTHTVNEHAAHARYLHIVPHNDVTSVKTNPQITKMCRWAYNSISCRSLYLS